MILKSYSVLRKVNILFILAIISLFVFPPVATVNSSELSDEDFLSSNYIEKIDEIKVGEVFKGRVITTQEKADLSKIAINVNKAELVDNKTDLFEQFDETYALTVYTESDGSFSFERPSRNISISIDLATLPKNYGVSKKTQFCMDYMRETNFNIYAIYDVKLEVKNHQLDNVNILSKEGIKLFANYEAKKVQEEITEYNVLEKQAISYQISVNVYDKTYSYDGAVDLSELTYWDKLTFLEDSKVITKDEKIELFSIEYQKAENQNLGVSTLVLLEMREYFLGNIENTKKDTLENLYNALFENETRGATDFVTATTSGNNPRTFYVFYDPQEGVSQTDAESLADEMVLIHEYFCDFIGYVEPAGFKYNANSVNDFSVFIKDINDFGYAQRQLNLYGELEYCYIELASSLFDIEENAFSQVAAHEYMHTILFEIGLGYSDDLWDGRTWIHESVANWAGLEFINMFKGEINHSKEYFEDYLNEYYLEYSYLRMTTPLEVGNNLYINRGYGAFGFWIFLTEKFQSKLIISEIIEETIEISSFYYATENILGDYNTNFSSVFAEYSSMNAKPNFFYSNDYNIDEYYTEDWVNPSIDKKTIFSTGKNFEMQGASNYFLEIMPLDTPQVNLVVTVSVEDFNPLYPLLLGFGSVGSNSYYGTDFYYSSSNIMTTSYVVPAYSNTYFPGWESLALIFSNGNFYDNISVTYDISYVTQVVTTGTLDSYNIKDRYYEDPYDNLIYLEKFIPNYGGIYEVIIDTCECNIDFSLKILDANFEVIKKYDAFENSPYSTTTVLNSNYGKLITYLCEGETYYITSNTSIDTFEGDDMREGIDILLTIRPVDNEENYIYLDQNEYYNSGNEIVHNDNMKIIQIEEDGLYDICFNRILGGGINIFILKKNLNGTYDILYEEIMNQYGNVFGVGKYLSFFEDDEIYIGYLKNDGPTNSVIKIEVEKIQVPFDVILDPATAIYKGTEVTMNGGTLLGTNIEAGYTRHAYLTALAPHQSRLLYNWYSSDESIAKVSEYGTVIACSPGKVFITAVYKTDSTQVGYVVVTVTSAVPPLAPNDFNYITLITDNRDNPLHNGTMYHYYPEEDNDIIYVGYTRAICIDMGNIYSPTSPTKIIQYFNWASSNSSIATIDEFGNITGISQGNVVIMGEYKFNEYYIGGLAIHITIE